MLVYRSVISKPEFSSQLGGDSLTKAPGWAEIAMDLPRTNVILPLTKNQKKTIKERNKTLQMIQSDLFMPYLEVT